MKRLVVQFLASVGGVSLLLTALYALILTFAPNYRTMARSEFATDEAIAAMHRLYERVESEKLPSLGLNDVRMPQAGFPRAREVTRQLTPWEFADWGAKEGDGLASWGDVVAYFDEHDQLLGIEFYGSRYGCFVSRRSNLCPPWFQTLERVTDRPLFVTVRLTGGD